MVARAPRSLVAVRVSGVQPARRIAFEVIVAVRESDAYANLLLPTKIQRAKLSAQDAGLATELTYGTLRGLGYYDAVIAHVARRPTAKIDPGILDLLRLGSHQLLAMRIAQHAAVDESVALAKEVARSAAGFVNGVLRTIGRGSPEQWRDRVLDGVSGADARLAIEHSHPEWVVAALRAALAAEGREAELPALLAADTVPPRVGLVALPGLATSGELDGTADRFSPLGAVSDSGDPGTNTAVAEGRARVQDEGSQLAALALSRARPIVAAERWLDLCAGPGGKAALLAAEAAGGGAEFGANEITPARAELVRHALAARAAPPTVTELDGRTIGRLKPGVFDRILLDAPCTGLGALRRRPEARWRKSPADVEELAQLQRDLLDSALDALKPGGLLAYVTCSPQLAETTAVVDAVLSTRVDARRLDTAAVLSRLTVHPLELGDRADGSVQLWPHRHGTDAMYICLIERAA
ncbi:transcription antitermination factor NusB [soil metagenome]